MLKSTSDEIQETVSSEPMSPHKSDRSVFVVEGQVDEKETQATPSDASNHRDVHWFKPSEKSREHIDTTSIRDAYLDPFAISGGWATELEAKSSRTSLSDVELDFLEGQIRSQASAATLSAFWDALTRGQSVVYTDGDELLEITSNGSRRVLKILESNIALSVGIEIALP